MTEFYNELMEWIKAKPCADKTITKNSPIKFESINVFDLLDEFTNDAVQSGWGFPDFNKVIDYALAGLEVRPSEQAQYRILMLIQSYYQLPLKICGGCGELTPRVLCHKCANPK